MNSWPLALAILLALTTHDLSAQTRTVDSGRGTIVGRVVDTDSGVGLAGAYITIDGTRLGAAADTSGAFTVTNVPAGEYRLVFQMIGYKTRVLRRVQVLADSTTSPITARLSEQSIELETVTVTSHRDRELEKQLNTSVHAIRPSDVVSLPGGGEDLFRTVQAMPGVVARADYGTQFYVRGGTPDQNLITIDGVPVFNPYRLKLLGGPVSMFNPDVVERVELLAGGFPAEYGDKLSSVLVIHNREGDRHRKHFRGGASLIDSRFAADGPIPGTQTDGSWLVAGRRTYYDLLFNRLDSLPKGTVLPFFRDVQTKIVQDLGPNQQIVVNILDSNEGTELKELDVEEEEDEEEEFFAGVEEFDLSNQIDNRLVSLGWNNALSDVTLSRLTLSHFDDDWFFRVTADEQFIQFQIDMRKLEIKEDLFHVATTDHSLLGGLSVTDFITDITAEIRQDSTSYFEDNPDDDVHFDDGALVEREFRFQNASTVSAFYVEDEVKRWAPLFTSRLGLRLDHSTFSREWKWSPRLSATYLQRDNLALRASWGLFYQSPNFVSLFERFEREIEWNLFETIQLKPEKAIHYLVGAEWRPTPAYTAKLEGYYKDLEHLVVATDSTYNHVPDNSGEGFAYGIEAFLQKRPSSDGRSWGWISYSLSTTKEKNRIDPLHPRDFDQRHTLNMIGSLRLGRGWSMNTRYSFGSGFPWTPVQTDSSGNPRFDEAGDVIWGRTNSRRNPVYRRWDLRLEWDRGATRDVRIQAYFEIINVLGRKNVHEYFWSDDYRTRGISYMLPRMPFFGLRLLL